MQRPTPSFVISSITSKFAGLPAIVVQADSSVLGTVDTRAEIDTGGHCAGEREGGDDVGQLHLGRYWSGL